MKCSSGLKKSKRKRKNDGARAAGSGRLLMQIYRRLLRYFGHRNWWPGDSPFEIIIGAILTQNTNWANVEKAITNLKRARILTPSALKRTSKIKLARLIKPCGYFNIKAQRLKHFLDRLFADFGGSLSKMLGTPPRELRKSLLEIKGIGPETADSILLYAAGRATFVVDAYTIRIFSRHGFIRKNAAYEEIKCFFESSLEKDAGLFNDFHAQIVECGKVYCRKVPLCERCPLNLPFLFL